MTHSTLLTLLLTTPFAAPLLPLAEKLLPRLQHIAHLLEAFRNQPITPAATHDFEGQLDQLLRQLGLDLCDWTYNHLEPDERADMPSRLDCDGERYRLRERSPNTIATLFGSFTLRRYLYEDLEPGNPCLFPLEKRLGVVAGAATPALADRAAWWFAQRPQGGTLHVLEREHDVTWSAEVLRRVTAAFAAALEEHRPAAQVARVVAWLEQAAQSRGRYQPQLVVGRDGVNVPMRGKQPYREGAVATLSVRDRQGKRLGTVYLGRMPQGGQGTLSAQLTALVEGVLRQWTGPLPRLVYVTDDGHHPATYYQEVLRRMRHPRTGERLSWQRVVDFYHATLYVHQLAEALFGETKAAAAWSRRMRERLKEKDGVKRVLQAASYYARTRVLRGQREEAYEQAYHYLRSNSRWMAYGAYKELGMPLGSGVTEAGCKVMVTQRLKQSGMRWEVAGGQVVLTLRAVLLSGVWEAAVGRLWESQTFPWPGVEEGSATQTLENAA
ncbi:MAG TPA: hypothetical protein VKD72_36825 [Gemmataceae bacterium]|nr:hypothetical protein [Gemmataceae bacterium]